MVDNASVRRLAIPAVVWLALLLSAPVAAAASVPCKADDGISCRTLTVPLDRSGGVPGTVDLRVERLRALSRASQAPIVALAGGPGQAATPFTSAFAGLLEPVLGSRDLIVFDQRGTGRSGLLRCPRLEATLKPESSSVASGPLTQAVEECAQSLGPRRSFYTTRDTVEDIEAIRRDLGVERISFYGVSYGTKVALAYAERYPEHVERLALDSVVERRGPDPLSRETFQATPRVLRDVCGARGCAGITTDPAGDLSRLVAQLAAGPLRGYRVGADGRRKPATLERVGLLDFLLAGDFLPAVRSLLPGAVQSALRGDTAPVLRLAAEEQKGSPPDPPRLFSPALFTATLCEEVDFPWERTASREERLAEARRRADALPDESFFPFDRETALEAGIIDLCAAWPAAEENPLPASEEPPPGPPTLVLSGEADLRTPLESAERVVAHLPSGGVVRVPDVGHSVLGQSFDECPERALTRFFQGVSSSRRCPRTGTPAPTPIAPQSLGEVPPIRGVGGRRGRTLGATALTLDDAFVAGLFGAESSSGFDARGGGLRSGRFRIGLEGRRVRSRRSGRVRTERNLTLRLDRLVYVPGVALTGALRFGSDFELAGRLRVDGSAAARGAITLSTSRRGYRFGGRLDGRRVRSTVRSPTFE